MIHLYAIKPCTDYPNSVQAEGVISKEHFTARHFEQLLTQINFTIFSIGDPIVLICRRSDCMLFVNSNGSFTISEVLSEEKLIQIIQEITDKITSFKFVG